MRLHGFMRKDTFKLILKKHYAQFNFNIGLMPYKYSKYIGCVISLKNALAVISIGIGAFSEIVKIHL